MGNQSSFNEVWLDFFIHLHERWISWFLASLKVAANCEMLVVWIARHIGPFRAAEHLTHWTFISLCRLSFVFSRRLQRARLSVLYFLHAIFCARIFYAAKINFCVCTYFFSHILCVKCSKFSHMNSVTLIFLSQYIHRETFLHC